MGRADKVKVWYDDRCGFCSFWVRRLKSGPNAHEVEFRPLDEPPQLHLDHDSIIVQKGNKFLQLSDAAIALGLAVGGRYAVLAKIARIFPHGLRDSLYRWVAKNRFGISKVCQLRPDSSSNFTPTGEVKTTASAS